MKYLIRSVKYFIFIAVFFCIAVSFIFTISEHQPGITIFDLFKNQEIKILLFFVAFSAVYPLLGYYTKKIYVDNNFKDKKDDICNLMTNANYILVSDQNNVITFRLKSPFLRFMRMYEDYIVIDYSDNPVIMSGLRKDVVRFGRGIEYIFQKEHDNSNKC